MYETTDALDKTSDTMTVDVARDLASSNISFLQYLKDLDRNMNPFPAHCRTIDFFLACKMPPINIDNDVIDDAQMSLDQSET